MHLVLGYHVLLEQPMEVSIEDYQTILGAQKKSGPKLMIIYRLHHRPGTLDVIDRVRREDFGDPRIFSFEKSRCNKQASVTMLFRT